MLETCNDHHSIFIMLGATCCLILYQTGVTLRRSDHLHTVHLHCRSAAIPKFQLSKGSARKAIAMPLKQHLTMFAQYSAH